MFKVLKINGKTHENSTVMVSDDWEKMSKLAVRCTFCESNKDVQYLAMVN